MVSELVNEAAHSELVGGGLGQSGRDSIQREHAGRSDTRRRACSKRLYGIDLAADCLGGRGGNDRADTMRVGEARNDN